jgi:hypothetical protein
LEILQQDTRNIGWELEGLKILAAEAKMQYSVWNWRRWFSISFEQMNKMKIGVHGEPRPYPHHIFLGYLPFPVD